MNGKVRRALDIDFERLPDGPVLAYITPGRIALRRKRALWVARCFAAARRRQFRRQLKEQQHGKH